MTTPEQFSKPPSDAEYYWVRHLLADERNLTLNTGHMSVLHSIIVEDELGFSALWRSFETTRHSRFIDSYADNAETGGLAPVEGIIYDSSSRLVSVSLFGHARRVPLVRAAGAIITINKSRGRKGYGALDGRLEVPYEMRIEQMTIPVPMFGPDASGELIHIGEDHAVLDMERLHGFAEP